MFERLSNELLVETITVRRVRDDIPCWSSAVFEKIDIVESSGVISDIAWNDEIMRFAEFTNDVTTTTRGFPNRVVETNVCDECPCRCWVRRVEIQSCPIEPVVAGTNRCLTAGAVGRR